MNKDHASMGMDNVQSEPQRPVATTLTWTSPEEGGQRTRSSVRTSRGPKSIAAVVEGRVICD